MVYSYAEKRTLEDLLEEKDVAFFKGIFWGLPRWERLLRPRPERRRCKRRGFNPWVRKDLLEYEMATHFSILA